MYSLQQETLISQAVVGKVNEKEIDDEPLSCKKSLLSLSPSKRKPPGIVSSSAQNILHHKMQHTPFFPQALISLIGIRFTPVQIHGSEQPFSLAEVGTHCWDVPHSRSPLCPAPGGKGRDTAITYPDFLQGLPYGLTSQVEAAELSWHKAQRRMEKSRLPRRCCKDSR